MRVNTQNVQQGEQETRCLGEGKNSEEQRLWKGEGLGRVHWVNKMDTTATFRKESREFEGGGFGVDERG